MSQAIEDKIVSLKFDNSGFESKIGSTISLLEKFEQKLGFKNAGNGLNDITKAAKNVDLSSIASGVDTLNGKFSGLGVVAATTISNITTSLESKLKNTINAFTLEPITAGLEEYETQMNSVQTILANTKHHGTTIDDVTDALGELNTYADQTIYNFTEMTRNIGTFTAAGLDLDTSTKAIQGIANLAATSGSTSQQATSAMYQLSQALSAGKVGLQDWNSVVNAGMGGKVFTDAIINTGKELGILDQSISDAYESGASFRSLLEGSDWFTKDILSATLSKFTKTGVVEYLSQTTGVAEESLQKLQELGDASGYDSKAFNDMALSLANGNAEMAESIRSTMDMTATAQDAATKVKTFSQLMDTLKEAVGSGWTESIQHVFGNFEEARETWTRTADFFSKIIDGMSKERNNMLQEWHDNGGRMDLVEGIATVGRTTFAVLRELTAGIRDVIPPMTAERLLAITKGFREFANSLKFATYGGKEAKNGIRLIGEGIGVVLKILLTGISIATKVGAVIFKVVWTVIKTILLVLGVIYSLGSAIQQGLAVPLLFITNAFGFVKDAFSDFLNIFSSGQEGISKFGDGIKSIFENSKVLDSVTKLANSIGMLVYHMASPIFNLFIGIFEEISELFNGFGDDNKALGFVERLANGFTSFIDVMTGIVSTIDSIGVFQWLASIAQNAGISLVNAFTAISNGAFGILKPATDFIGNIFTTIGNDIEGFKANIETAVEAIKNAFSSLNGGELKAGDTNGFKGLSLFSGISAGLDAFIDKIGSAINKLKQVFGKVDFAKVGLTAFVALQSFFQMKTIKQFMNAVENFSGVFEGLGNIPDVMEGFSGVLESYQNKLNGEAIKSIAVAIAILAGSMLLMSMIPTEKIPQAVAGLAALLFVMSNFMDKLDAMAKNKGKSFQIVGKQFSMETGGLGDIVKGMIGIALATLILAKAVSMLAEYDLGELIVSIGACTALMVALVAMTGVMAGLNGNDKFNFDGLLKIAIGMSILSVAVLIMAAAVKVLSTIDTNSLVIATLALGAIMVTMTAFAFVVGQVPEGKFISAAVAMVGLAVAISMLTIPIMILGNMDQGKLIQGGTAVALLMALMAFISRAAKGSFGGAASIMAIGLAVNMLVIPIKTLADMETEKALFACNQLRKIIGMLGIAAALAGATSGGALAIVALAVAVNLLIPAIQKIADMNGESIAKGLLVLGGALAGLIGLGYLANGAAPGLVALGIAVVAIGVGCMLAGVGITMLASGLIALSGAAVVVGGGLTTLAVELATAFVAALAIVAVGLAEAVVLFVETLAAAAPTILLQIEIIAKMIFKLIEDLGPEFIDSVIPIIDRLLDTIEQKAPEWGAKLVNIVIGLLTGVLGALLGKIVEFATVAGEFISAMADKFFNDTTIGQALLTLFDFVVALINSDVVVNFVKFIGNVFEAIVGFINGDLTIGEALSQVWQGLVDAFKDSWVGKFVSLGKNLVQGIIDGISSLWDKAVGKAEDLGNATASAANTGARTASPSRITTETGKNIALGLPKGIKENSQSAVVASKRLGKTVSEALSTAMEGLDTIYEENAAVMSPSITPVVDLSNVSKSTSMLSNMFGKASLAQMQLAGIGNISMGSVYSNMAVDTDNSDVVKEVRYLRQELEYVNNTIRQNSRPTTQHNYNIAGVTYGSDSEISDALQNLMNVIKVKGRM